MRNRIRLLGVFALALFLSGCLEAQPDNAQPRGLGTPGSALPRLLDPALTVGQDRPLLGERVRAREVDVATDPNNPLHMAAVMMVPYPTQYALAPYDSMQWTGLALSDDGGKNWKYEPIRGYPGDTTPGPFPGAWALGDAVLAFQPDGSLLMAVLVIRPPVAISFDVAEFAWGSREPRFVSEFSKGALGVKGLHDVPTSQPGMHVDKEQISINPVTNVVYAAWAERWQQTSEARQVFAKSRDGGRTWTEPLPLAPPSPHYVGAGQHQMGGWPINTADGRLLVFWADWRANTLYVSESVDDGNSFKPPRAISQHPGFYVPSVGIDLTGGPEHGTLYVALEDNRNGNGDGDVYLHVSRDGGATWNDSVRVNQDPIGNKVDHRMPELVVEPDGAVSIVYMAASGGPQAWHAFVARSIDGGRSFTEYQVSSAPTSPASMNNQPSFLTHLGDYFGISHNDHGIVAVWQDGRKSTTEKPYSEAWMVELPTRDA